MTASHPSSLSFFAGFEGYPQEKTKALAELFLVLSQLYHQKCPAVYNKTVDSHTASFSPRPLEFAVLPLCLMPELFFFELTRPVFLDAFNSHSGSINRLGLEISTSETWKDRQPVKVTSTAYVYLWANRCKYGV